MIQEGSLLRIIDNSGAKTVKCIKVLGGFKKKYANKGDFIIVSVQQLRNRFKKESKVKKREIYKAIIIRTKTKFFLKTGVKIKFFENSAVLLNKQGSPVGTRVLGPVPKTFRAKGFKKLVSISNGLI